MDFKNKVVIVTGGSSGIGYETVRKFLSYGAKVALASIDLSSAMEAVKKLQEEFPNSEIMGIAPKLNDFDSVKKDFDAVIAHFGRVDVLVNNAGISDETHFEDYKEEIYDKVFDINLKSMFACSKAVLDIMSKNHSGVIINTSSYTSICGSRKGIAYPTSKGAVNSFTLNLARELAPKGIRVNAVAPGVTNTAMMRNVPQKYIDMMTQAIPLGRIGQPSDVANAITFLASDLASYITGVVLPVDGLVRF